MCAEVVLAVAAPAAPACASPKLDTLTMDTGETLIFDTTRFDSPNQAGDYCLPPMVSNAWPTALLELAALCDRNPIFWDSAVSSAITDGLSLPCSLSCEDNCTSLL